MNSQNNSKEVEITYEYVYNLLSYFCKDLDKRWLNVEDITRYIFKSIKPKMYLEDLYNYIADYSASKASYHPDYKKLASNICMFVLHNNTSEIFKEVINKLYYNIDKEGNQSPLISTDVYEIVEKYNDLIQNEFHYDRDYSFDYFAIKTLERSYLYRLHYIKNNNGSIIKLNKTIERPQHMFMRVALGIHGNNLNKVFESYHLMSNKYFTHATPTLFNAGSIRSQMSSCFLLHMSDSIEGIFETITDIALISKWAGGIGISLSDIRAKGSIIRKTNGLSEGIVPLCKVLNAEATYIDQGGKRKGSFNIFLEPWHADIYEFCNFRKNTDQEKFKCRDIFMSLWICDLFMIRVLDDGIWSLMCPDECQGLTSSYGEEFEQLYTKYEKEGKYKRQVRAIDLWYHILESQIETGMPFMLYKDSANRKSNQKNLGTIKSSNLCVAPETKILTDVGYKIISELKNKKVKVWNGEQFSEVIVKKTGTNKKLLKISFSNGATIECTENHKFYIQNLHCISPTIVEAKYLKKGMKIIKYNLPLINGKEDIKYAYISGLFSAEGSYVDNHKIERCSYKKYGNACVCSRHTISEEYKDNENTCFVGEINNDTCIARVGSKRANILLYDSKKMLIDHIEKRLDLEIIYENDRINVKLPSDIPEKYTVPINGCIQNKLEWLAGLMDGDGTLSICRTNKQLQITSVNIKFLEDVKLMCTTLGINPKISTMHNKCSKLYECTSLFKLLISPHDLYKLQKIGLKTNRLNITQNKPKYKSRQHVTVKSIVNTDRISDTYCFTESLKHMGIFNGILTGQCTEIIEYSDDKSTAVCNLASLCLPKFIELNNGKKEFNFDKLIQVAGVIVRNLDIIIDKNFYPTPKTFISNINHRPVGIGVQGLADVYNIMSYSFDSKEAKDLNKLIFESLYYGCLLASNDLAKELGSYNSFNGSPSSEGKLQFHLWGLTRNDLSGRYDWDSLCTNIKLHGLRNSLLTTVMPTATTSQIMGNSESIDPYLSNVFTRQTLAGEFIVINENLINDLIEGNLWSEDIRKKIIVMNGSIAQIKEIPLHIKNLYKTAFEIKMKDILQQSIDRGVYIDQSQSLNLYMETSDFDRLTSSHFYGWKNGLKTGMYYLRSRPSINPIQFGIDINEVNKIKTESEINKIKSESEINKIKTESEVKMCNIRPGIKVKDCTICT